MVTAEVVYTGRLHTEARHVLSGTVIQTDAPKDNQGQGEAFSPTDLLAVSLLTCIITTMNIYAKNHGLEDLQMHGSVEKIMSDTPPRRVARLNVKIEISGANLSEKQREALERSGNHCPVHLSLHPDVEQEIAYSYT